MGFFEGLKNGLERMAEEAKRQAEERERLEMDRARQIYRNGGNCFSCRYSNCNGFCDNTNSKAYDSKASNFCNRKYGVNVCPHYSRN